MSNDDSVNAEVTAYIAKEARFYKEHAAIIFGKAKLTPDAYESFLRFYKKLLIHLIVTHQGEPDPEVWKLVGKYFSKDFSFFLSLSRALAGEQGHELFDATEKIIIANWVEVKLYGTWLPGLRHWKLGAMASFLRFSINEDPDASISDQAFDKTRQRLELEKGDIIVTSFSTPVCPDRSRSKIVVQTRTEEVVISCPEK